MSTLSTRLSLLKAAGTDLVNVLTQLANALDKIDDSVGVYNCTAATHPVVNLFDGRLIRETDTGDILRYDAVTVGWLPIDTRGIIGTTLGAGADCVAGFTDVCTLAVNVIAGRKYKVTGFVNGTQITAIGTSRTQIADDQAGLQWIAYTVSLAVNQKLLGTGVHEFTATTTRLATMKLQGASTAGALRVVASDSKIIVEDVG